MRKAWFNNDNNSCLSHFNGERVHICTKRETNFNNVRNES